MKKDYAWIGKLFVKHDHVSSNEFSYIEHFPLYFTWQYQVYGKKKWCPSSYCGSTCWQKETVILKGNSTSAWNSLEWKQNIQSPSKWNVHCSQKLCIIDDAKMTITPHP